MSKAYKRPKIRLPSEEEDAAIVAAAKADPDAPQLTRRQLKEMVPYRALRGRPKSESTKQLVSIRYSPEVIAYFRATGEGWQSRMDAVLRKYIETQSSASQRGAEPGAEPDRRERATRGRGPLRR